MKKMLEKHGKVRLISGLIAILSIVLFIIAAFMSDKVKLVMDVIGFLLLTGSGLVYVYKTDEHRLAKMLLFLTLEALLMTWIFPYGYFQGIDFYDYGMNRVGVTDLGYILYNIIAFTVDKLIYLLVVAGFYGVLSKVSGYQKLVSSIAQKLKKHPMVTSIVISLIIVVLTSLVSSAYVLLIFVPFFMAILLNMKLDKLTTFAVTFGSILIGILGATFGTEAYTNFSYYLGIEMTDGIVYRVIIAVVAFILYSFFICMRLKKVLKQKSSEKPEEPIEEIAYAVEPTRKSVHIVPALIIMLLVFVLTILGFVSWSDNFNITVFTKFHEWLTGLKIGKDFTIFAYLLGSQAAEFGTFNLRTITIVLVLASILMALLYRVKLNDYIDNFYKGIKKMFKPILYFMAVYGVFVACYLSPFIPTITNWALNLTSNFNPYITTVLAFVSSLFHADFGYTAYSVGGYLSAAYADSLSIVSTIYFAMYGIVQIMAPTSAILVLGLNLMKIDYKSWLKFIWLFVVGMVVILLVLFTVITYI